MAWFTAQPSSGSSSVVGGTGINSIVITGSPSNVLVITGSPTTGNAVTITMPAASATGDGYLTSGDYSLFLAGGTTNLSGVVSVLDSNGGRTFFTAAADTSAARGTALINAVATVTSGDAILLEGGDYYLGAAGLSLVNVHLIARNPQLCEIWNTGALNTIIMNGGSISNVGLRNSSGPCLQVTGANITNCSITGSQAVNLYNTCSVTNSTLRGNSNVLVARANAVATVSNTNINGTAASAFYGYSSAFVTFRDCNLISTTERAIAGDDCQVTAYNSYFEGNVNGAVRISNTLYASKFYDSTIIGTHASHYPINGSNVARAYELYGCTVSGASNKSIDTILCTVRMDSSTQLFGATTGNLLSRLTSPINLMGVPTANLSTTMPSYTGTRILTGGLVSTGTIVYDTTANTPVFYNGTTWVSMSGGGAAGPPGAPGGATLSGVVSLIQENGTITSYMPSADTNLGRGDALNNAIAAAVAGDVISLLHGPFYIATDSISLDGISIVGIIPDVSYIYNTHATNSCLYMNGGDIKNVKVWNATGPAVQVTGTHIENCVFSGTRGLDAYGTWYANNSSMNGTTSYGCYTHSNATGIVDNSTVYSRDNIGLAGVGESFTTIRDSDVTSTLGAGIGGVDCHVDVYNSYIQGADSAVGIAFATTKSRFYNTSIIENSGVSYPMTSTNVGTTHELYHCVVSGASNKSIDTTACTVRIDASTQLLGKTTGTNLTRFSSPINLMGVASGSLNSSIPSFVSMPVSQDNNDAGTLAYNTTSRTPAYHDGANWNSLYPYGYTFCDLHLPMARHFGVQSGNMPTGVDVWTGLTAPVPTGSKYLMVGSRMTTAAGGNEDVRIAVDIAGVKYDLGYVLSLNLVLPFVLESGMSLHARPTNVVNGVAPTGANLSVSFISIPSGVPIKSSYLFNMTAGSSTLYTCPANTVTRIGMGGDESVPNYGLSNITTAAGFTGYLHIVPSGGVATVDNRYYYLIHGAFNNQSSSFKYTSMDAVLTAGQTVVVRIDSSVIPVTGNAWITYTEYPAS